LHTVSLQNKLSPNSNSLCTKFDFGNPRFRWGAYSTPQTLCLDLRGVLVTVRKGRGERKGGERERGIRIVILRGARGGKRMEGRGKEGRKRERRRKYFALFYSVDKPVII